MFPFDDVIILSLIVEDLLDIMVTLIALFLRIIIRVHFHICVLQTKNKMLFFPFQVNIRVHIAAFYGKKPIE